MKNKLIISIFLAVIFFGCQKNISLNIPKYEGKVVVFCILQPNQWPDMSLTLSQSYYSYADTTGQPTYITNAQVTITDQNTNIVDTLIGHSFGYYQGHHNTVAGHHYIANINYQGKKITAETTVPMPVKIDHIDYVKLSPPIGPGVFDSSYFFSIFFNDIPGEADYYAVTQSSKYTFNNAITGYSVFTTDAGLDGKQIDITTELINNDSVPPSPPFLVTFNLENATKETYDYFNSINSQSNSANNPFSQPVMVKSNINGGLGLFGAMTPSPDFFVNVKK